MEHKDCEKLVECLSDYIDGELPPELVEKLEAHIQGCNNCRIVVDTTKKTISLYHQVADEQHAPDAVVEKLHKILDISNLIRD